MAKKKQFKKEIELSEDQIFEDTESILEKEQIEKVIKAGKEKQILNIPKISSTYNLYTSEHTHRIYLSKRYGIDPNKPIGIDTEKTQVFNFDFKERGNKTLPEYIESLGYSWTNFMNYQCYDPVELSEYILKY